jgi:anti-anti-sigma regulatory factor
VGPLDISAAGKLRDALRECLSRQPELLLDLSDADACDASILQLLWAARKSASECHKRFSVVSSSDAVRETGAALGLSLDEVTAQEGDGVL